LLYRLLQFLGADVTYCRNFTDIDDKLINRAEKDLNDATQYPLLANRYIESFHADMKKLNCLPPAVEPRVTMHIPQIISFIEGLIKAEHAYVTPLGDVYFSIRSFKPYGELSKRSLDDLEAGARVSVRADKHDPLDFALWKSADEAPGWESPWGFGRPGWHIECSALAKEYLGDTIDIHGGGMDLIFPHHENEKAQSEALSKKPLARFWLHNAFVRIDQEKMSKSLGNFLTLSQVCDQFNPMVVRYYYLQHHYRSPLDFTKVDIEAAGTCYERLCSALENYPIASQEDILRSDSLLVRNLIKALCDDLTVARLCGLLFENIKGIGPEEASLVKGVLYHLLGLSMEPLPRQEVVITPEIQALLDARIEARKAKDWKRSDELRDALRELGVEVQDSKSS
jgi:cysteinyl-tRNA synthetase